MRLLMGMFARLQKPVCDRYRIDERTELAHYLMCQKESLKVSGLGPVFESICRRAFHRSGTAAAEPASNPEQRPGRGVNP